MAKIIHKNVEVHHKKSKSSVSLFQIATGVCVFFLVSLEFSIHHSNNVYMLQLRSRGLDSKNYRARYEARKIRLQNSCGNPDRNKMTWNDRNNFIVAMNVNYAICVVQKAASTSWFNVVWNSIRPNQPFPSEAGPFRMGQFSFAKHLNNSLKDELTHSHDTTRILTVRHPFARLVSMWNQKYMKPDPIEHPYIPPVKIEEYSAIYPPDDGHWMSFEAFIQYVVDTDRKKLNNHFKSVEELCDPCNFPYDYIVKAETSHEDGEFVTRNTNLTLYEFNTQSYDGIKYSNNAFWEINQKIVQKYFQLISLKNKLKLIELYKDDFNRFGYSFDVANNMMYFDD